MSIIKHSLKKALIGMLMLVFWGSAQSDSMDPTVSEKIWASLQKAERKLNKGMPKQLAPNLWIRQVRVDKKQKLLKYEGMVTGQGAKRLTEETIQTHKMRYRQMTLNFLCDNPQSKTFLSILNRADARVRYLFYANPSQDQRQKSHNKSEQLELLFFFDIQEKDCQKKVLS